MRKTGYAAFSRQTSGKILEFIGTSGAGKTTLFNRSMTRLKNRWFFAYHMDLFKRKAPPSQVDEILMQILQKRIENINSSESFCPWHSLLDLKLSVRVMHETMVVAHSAYPKGFAFDEGLFRHFTAEILQLDDLCLVDLWKNRAFVYLRARTPETALARVKSRTEKLTQLERQRDRTDDQILFRIVQEQEMFQSIIDKAATFDCPVLVIDAEDPFEDSVNRVLDFESSLIQRFKSQETRKTTSDNSIAQIDEAKR